MDSSCWDFPTDVFVEILRRLPPNARRRFRQVCRQWRDTIDTRAATDMRPRTKSIVVTTDGSTYVVDLQSPPGQTRELWRKMGFRTAKRYKAMGIVNTCNGLVCLCDDTAPGGGGAITCDSAAWRCVPTNTDDAVDTRCRLGPCHLANVDGTVYWLTQAEVGEMKIISMDLKDERVVTLTPIEPLPVMGLTSCFLTKVLGRLAVVADDSVTVWVLEGERWSLGYIMETHRLRQQERWLRRELALPQFAAGDYILTHKGAYNSVLGQKCVLYGHRTGSNAARLHPQEQGLVAQIGHKDHGEVVQDFLGCVRSTFAYVETEEPLGVYNLDLVTGGGFPGS
ncbi:hypothetical protein BRADI_4g11055v3 [Brachypodium distachyon]|uniref:F-box domain-containing protein n=1 Tax=Brachypodium distachyon TaxID=15368 RepID=A0A0Q3HG85_BRADI|nr:hypothetical protein BRADI_4g11055v3 [Brachypodium distachyon]